MVELNFIKKNDKNELFLVLKNIDIHLKFLNVG